MKEPPTEVITLAVGMARMSPCAKSKRGVVAYSDAQAPHLSPIILGLGYNHPALGICDGSPECKRDCAKLCTHAEAAAVREAMERAPSRSMDSEHPIYLVHVKVVQSYMVPGGGPSCWQCSKLIIDHTAIRGVWLYETTVSAPDPEWKFYTSGDFHIATLLACGIHAPQPMTVENQR